MAAPPTIASLCASCSSQIALYLADPYLHTENQARHLQKKLAHFVEMFNVNGTGLFSLDYLLRSEPGLLKRLLFLLCNTAENLARAVEARQVLASSAKLPAAHDDIDDSSSAATSGNTFATYRSRVTSALDPLETIERNIKRLSIMSKYIDAAIPHFQVIRFMMKDQTLAEFERFIRSIIQFKFKKLPASVFLFERIVASLVLRRARFNYLRARSNRFAVAGQPSCSAETIAPPAAIAERSPAPSIGASAVSSFILRPRVSLPKPRRVEYGQNHVRCLCCLQPVSVNDNAWQHHLIGDIQPLICIQENCDRVLDTFTTTHAWLEHMVSHNQGWYCHASTHSGEVLSFSTQRDFEQHMQLEHLQPTTGTAIRDASFFNGISIISSNSRRPSPVVTVPCLFCASDTWDDESVTEYATESGPYLSTHIYNHLLDLALYSLPEPESGIDASLASDVLSSRQSSVSLVSVDREDLDWFEADELGTDEPSQHQQHMFEDTLEPLGVEHLDEGKGQGALENHQMRFEEVLNSGQPFASSQSAIDSWLQALPAMESLTMNPMGDYGDGETRNQDQMKEAP